MVEQISVLHLRETAYFDEDILKGLSRDLGPGVAENILCRALEDMAMRFSQIRHDYADGNQRALRKSVHALIPIADQVGLPGLARTGRDVMICIDRGDPVAIAATLARLLRCGEMVIACGEIGVDLSI